MLKRLLTGIVLVIVLVPVFVLYDTPLMPALFTVIGVISMIEVTKCVGFGGKKYLYLTLPMYVIAGLLPFLQYFAGTTVPGAASQLLTLMMAAVFVIYALRVFGVKDTFSPMADAVTMLVYVTGAEVGAVAVSMTENGGYILPFLFICSWVTDIFAYVCGSLFGKHKLIPKVSPKKTVEGSIGGSLMTTAAAYVYMSIVHFGDAKETVVFTIAAFVLSVLSQIGDLNASFLKRKYGIKDYGRIFPGHGGMLDRFDSVIAIAPFLYVFVIIITYFL